MQIAYLIASEYAASYGSIPSSMLPIVYAFVMQQWLYILHHTISHVKGKKAKECI